MAKPGAESPALALEVRRDIGRHHRALDEKGTHAAHGIGQRTTRSGDTRPAGTDEDRRRQVFLQRGRALLQPVATLMQAVP